MENFDQKDAMDMSDDDDLRLFASLRDPGLARSILCIKRNDPEAIWLDICCFDSRFDERVWRRLRNILRRNTTVRLLSVHGVSPSAAALLLAGIEDNRSIEIVKLHETDLRGAGALGALAPHLIGNTGLQRLEISRCGIGSAGIDILSRALSDRSEGTLEYLGLGRNDIPDVDLDRLALALGGDEQLRWLSLSDNRIGARGCASLAKLLEDARSNLKYLLLDGNLVDDESAAILAKSLIRNTELRVLDMARNEKITTAGMSSALKLVCHCSNSCIDDVVNSNHTIHGIEISPSDLTRTWGVDDTNLLRASLETNKEMFYTGNKMVAPRRKVMWSHARGSLNLGCSSIDTGTMPRILEWIVGPNETSLVQYHDPPLPEPRLAAMKLDALYRIARSRPDLCAGFNNLSRSKNKI